MTIVNKPSALSLSGNLTKFLISSVTSFTFILKKGTETLLEQIYDPGSAGQVEIDVREIVEANLSYTLQEAAAIYEQATIADTFTAEIGAETVTFIAIRAGVDRLADSANNFLTANFLTWQPQVKKISYYSPEFLTYYAVVTSIVKLEAHYSDNTIETITLGNLTSGKAYTIPAQYALINSLLTKKLPGYYDIYITDVDDNRLTYIQRFLASNKLSEDEQWFMFENSLGGMDAIRAYGQNDFSAEHTHNIAEIDEISSEYRVDTERKFKKNTGYLDIYERVWLLDFFPSRSKYIYAASAIRPIVVVEDDASYNSKELPSNYNFTYQYADSKPFLNLTRNNSLPADVALEVPDIGGSFILPPRLADFPHITLTGGALTLIQDPYSESWGVMTLDGLAQFLGSKLIVLNTFIQSIRIPENEQGESIGLQAEKLENDTVISIKLEPKTAQTVDDGHIAISANQGGELYGEQFWNVETEGVQEEITALINEGGLAEEIESLISGSEWLGETI